MKILARLVIFTPPVLGMLLFIVVFFGHILNDEGYITWEVVNLWSENNTRFLILSVMIALISSHWPLFIATVAQTIIRSRRNT